MQAVVDIQRQRDEFAEGLSQFVAACEDFVDAIKQLVTSVAEVLIPMIAALVALCRAHLVRIYWGEPEGISGFAWKVLRYPRRLWHRAFGHSGIVTQLGGYCRACDLWIDLA